MFTKLPLNSLALKVMHPPSSSWQKRRTYKLVVVQVNCIHYQHLLFALLTILWHLWLLQHRTNSRSSFTRNFAIMVRFDTRSDFSPLSFIMTLGVWGDYGISTTNFKQTILEGKSKPCWHSRRRSGRWRWVNFFIRISILRFFYKYHLISPLNEIVRRGVKAYKG